MNPARSCFNIWGQGNISVKNTHWRNILFDKSRKILKLDTNKQNQSWNFYRYPPGLIRRNQVIRLQSAEGGRCNNQFTRSSKRYEAQREVSQTQNWTETGPYPIRNTL